MEPVTHMLTGACLSRAGFDRKTAYATVAMAIAGEAPDLDMLWGLKGPVAELQHHRGITHAFLGAPFMALGTVLLILLWQRVRPSRSGLPIRWGWLWIGALVADLSHILLDFTTSYGVRPFFPIHDQWYAASLVYLFDPFIFLVLALALAMPMILARTDMKKDAHRDLRRSRAWAWAALLLVAAWWGVRHSARAQAEALVRHDPSITQPLLRVAPQPRMDSPFHWMVLMDTGSAYRIAEVNTLEHEIVLDPRVVRKPPVTADVTTSKQSYLGQVYVDWSKWPLIEDMGRTVVPIPPATPPPGEDWHTVGYLDLRFDQPELFGSRVGYKAAHAPLIGWVYVDDHGNEAMFMHGQRQR